MAHPLTNVTRFPTIDVVAKTAAAGIVVGDIVRVTTTGDGVLAGVNKALASSAAEVDGTLGYLVGGVADGSTAPANGAVVAVKFFGIVLQTSHGADPAPAVGDPVYVSDTGTARVVSGTNQRQIGEVIAVAVGGGNFDWLFNGLAAKVGGVAPAAAAYLVDSSSDVPGLSSERLMRALTAELVFSRVGPDGVSAASPFRIANQPAAAAGVGLGVAVGHYLKGVGGTSVLAGASVVSWESLGGAGTEQAQWLLVLQGADGVAETRLSAGRFGLRLLSGTGTMDITREAAPGPGGLRIGNKGAAGVFYLMAGGVDRWEIDATTGNLKAMGGNRAIEGVATPVADMQAANKLYVDSVAQSKLVTFVTKTSADSPYAVVATDELVIGDTATGNITINLPSATPSAGRRLMFKKPVAANTLTIDGAGGETIDGSLTYDLVALNAAIQIISDGARWHVCP